MIVVSAEGPPRHPGTPRAPTTPTPRIQHLRRSDDPARDEQDSRSAVEASEGTSRPPGPHAPGDLAQTASRARVPSTSSVSYRERWPPDLIMPLVSLRSAREVQVGMKRSGPRRRSGHFLAQRLLHLEHELALAEDASRPRDEAPAFSVRIVREYAPEPAPGWVLE